MSGDDGTGMDAAAPVTVPGRVVTRSILTAVDSGAAANRMAASGTSSLLRGTARATESGLDATRAGAKAVACGRVDDIVDEVVDAFAGSTVGRLDAAAGEVSRLAARTDRSLDMVRTGVHASAATVVGPIADHEETADAVEIEID